MTLQRTALLALIAVALRSVFIFQNTALPLLGVWDLEAAVYFNACLAAVMLPAAWIVYFATVWRTGSAHRAALFAAAVIGLNAAVDLYRQAATISIFSLDSWTLLAGSTLPAAIWILYLLHQAGLRSKPRRWLWYLLFATLAQSGFAVAGILDSFPQFAHFYNIDPRIRTVFGFAVAHLLYWLTQALFIRQAQRPGAAAGA